MTVITQHKKKARLIALSSSKKSTPVSCEKYLAAHWQLCGKTSNFYEDFGPFLGPVDLSAALGHFGKVNHPEVQEAIAHVLAAGKKAHKIGGIYAFNSDDARKRIEQGFQLVCLGSDSRLLMGVAQESLKRVREKIS